LLTNNLELSTFLKDISFNKHFCIAEVTFKGYFPNSYAVHS